MKVKAIKLIKNTIKHSNKNLKKKIKIKKKHCNINILTLVYYNNLL